MNNSSADFCNLPPCESEIFNNTCGAGTGVTSLGTFNAVYKSYHGYISSSVCLFGVILNVLTCIVLTRQNMRTPTNFLLTTVAIADMVKMASYAIYTLYLNVFTESTYCGATRHRKSWMVFVLLHTFTVISMHTISTVAMVCLAVMRCISVYMPLSGPKLCTMRNVRVTVLVVSVISAISASPTVFMYRVCQLSQEGAWWFDIRSWATNLETANFIIYGMVVKILASILISILSAFLILAMRRASQRHSRLRGQQKPRKASRAIGDGASEGNQTDAHTRESNRNTAMLATVVISFVVTEFPQGVVNMTAALSICFHLNVYAMIGDFMDTLVLLNSSINFILYCAMSQQFRETFCRLFCCNRQANPPSGVYRLTTTKGTA